MPQRVPIIKIFVNHEQHVKFNFRQITTTCTYLSSCAATHHAMVHRPTDCIRSLINPRSLHLSPSMLPKQRHDLFREWKITPLLLASTALGCWYSEPRFLGGSVLTAAAAPEVETVDTDIAMDSFIAEGEGMM